MKRVFGFCSLVIIAISFLSVAEANNAFAINKQLGIANQQQAKNGTIDNTQRSIQQSIEQLAAQANKFDQIQTRFNKHKAALEKQISSCQKRSPCST